MQDEHKTDPVFPSDCCSLTSWSNWNHSNQINHSLLKGTEPKITVYSLEWGWSCKFSTYNSPILNLSFPSISSTPLLYILHSISLQQSLIIQVRVALFPFPCKMSPGRGHVYMSRFSGWLNGSEDFFPHRYQKEEHWRCVEGEWE